MKQDDDSITMSLPIHRPSVESHGSDHIVELQVPAPVFNKGAFQRDLAQWLRQNHPDVKLIG